ncbi:MAG TPA: amidase domain-containing protein [Candidatus Saccharimonadales bacterium]|nr:amidase domain-containing protein [Candidatus Saccharimonadales bacterium]
MPELLEQTPIEPTIMPIVVDGELTKNSDVLNLLEGTPESVSTTTAPTFEATPDTLFNTNPAALAVTETVDVDFIPRNPDKQSLTRRFLNTCLGRLALSSLTTLGLASGGIAVEAAPAFADSNPVYTVTNHDHDGTHGIYYRNSPSMSDTSRQLPYYAKYGDRIELICGTDGEAVGQYNNHRWHLAKDLDNTAAPGEFYIPDHDTNTPNKANQVTPGERECGDTQEQAPQVLNPNFNRSAGVDWALAHAEDPQTNGEECAKFISHALWNAGLPQTKEWSNEGGYWSQFTHFDGTVAANAAGPLLDYLKRHYSTTWESLGKMAPNNNNIPLAQPGDIIAYSWNGDGAIDHVALVVGSAKNNPDYPLVAEWGQFNWSDNFGINMALYNVKNPKAPYTERGWTWSAMNNEWLQSEKGNKGMTAYLLHINGGYFAPSF